MNPYRSLKDMAQEIMVLFGHKPPAFTHGVILGCLVAAARGEYREAPDQPVLAGDIAPPPSIAPGSINYCPPTTKRSLREMAQSAAKTFALQLPPEPLSFGRDRFAEYMAGVIEALLLTAARGEYRPAASPISEQYPRQVIHDGSVWGLVDGECIGLSSEVLSAQGYIDHPIRFGNKLVSPPSDPNAPPPDIFKMMEEGMASMGSATKGAIYRAAGLDPDGEPAGLPRHDEPKERPFVPNKFGEHD